MYNVILTSKYQCSVKSPNLMIALCEKRFGVETDKWLIFMPTSVQPLRIQEPGEH